MKVDGKLDWAARPLMLPVVLWWVLLLPRGHLMRFCVGPVFWCDFWSWPVLAWLCGALAVGWLPLVVLGLLLVDRDTKGWPWQ